MIEIVYNGEVIATVEDKQVVTLKCEGNTMASDVDIIVEGTGTMKVSDYWTSKDMVAGQIKIECGFKPDVVFITVYGVDQYDLDQYEYCSKSAIVWCTDHPYMAADSSTLLLATENGFLVGTDEESTFNETDHTYHYLAVKFG